MNHWMWLVSLVGILSTAVVYGTDMFFLTIGRPALRLASPSAGTEIMGFFHMFADARMPIWGVSAILSNFLLVVLSNSGQRWFYFASLAMLILFVIIYARLSKPINRLQTDDGFVHLLRTVVLYRTARTSASAGCQVKHFKSLLIPAADALEKRLSDTNTQLAHELRKAAESTTDT